MAQANDSFFERSDFPTGIYVAASDPVIEIVLDDEVVPVRQGLVPSRLAPIVRSKSFQRSSVRYETSVPQLLMSQPAFDHMPHVRACLAIVAYLFMLAGVLLG